MSDRVVVHHGANGLNGLDGRDGKSAYQLAVAGGFTGTVEQWLKSLRGPAGGQKGDNGQDGREVELKRSETHLAWRYVGDESLTDLLPLADIKGADGINGKDGAPGKNGRDGKDGADGKDGREVELRADAEWIQWRYVGDDAWIDLVPLELLKGKDGRDGKDGRRVGVAGGLPASSTTSAREIELRNSGTYIQWRYVGDAAWTDLVALADITGAPGADGADGTIATVYHGATAGTDRPDVDGIVTWVGSVEPTNASNNDIWVNTA